MAKKKDNTLTIVLVIIIAILLFFLLRSCKQIPSGGNNNTGGGDSNNDNNNPSPDTDTNNTQDNRQPCAQFIYATPEACAASRCDKGTCIYVPATTGIPAKCQCQWCEDTDGGQNYAVRGTCTDYLSQSYTDVCPVSTFVSEAYCEGSRCMGLSVQCPSNGTCSDGSCR